jgi:hypothetical protein
VEAARQRPAQEAAGRGEPGHGLARGDVVAEHRDVDPGHAQIGVQLDPLDGDDARTLDPRVLDLAIDHLGEGVAQGLLDAYSASAHRDPSSPSSASQAAGTQL